WSVLPLLRVVNSSPDGRLECHFNDSCQSHGANCAHGSSSSTASEGIQFRMSRRPNCPPSPCGPLCRAWCALSCGCASPQRLISGQLDLYPAVEHEVDAEDRTGRLVALEKLAIGLVHFVEVAWIAEPDRGVDHIL